ncbi:MAG: hypothetical protein NVS4B6_05950 [Mycobacterium sp.]
MLTEFGHALREVCGRIHWAGTESSAIMCGWIDGAVRSGERAATEVMAADAVVAAKVCARAIRYQERKLLLSCNFGQD